MCDDRVRRESTTAAKIEASARCEGWRKASSDLEGVDSCRCAMYTKHRIASVAILSARCDVKRCSAVRVTRLRWVIDSRAKQLT